MLKLIIGAKGSGKTKTLIELVNNALKETKGSVVCIEKGDKLRFDISYQCRLIDTDEYQIKTPNGLYGFVAGILASNHDVSDLFIDSALKICGDDVATFEEFVPVVEAIGAKWNIEIVMTSSIAEADLPESLKKYL